MHPDRPPVQTRLNCRNTLWPTHAGPAEIWPKMCRAIVFYLQGQGITFAKGPPYPPAPKQRIEAERTGLSPARRRIHTSRIPRAPGPVDTASPPDCSGSCTPRRATRARRYRYRRSRACECALCFLPCQPMQAQLRVTRGAHAVPLRYPHPNHCATWRDPRPSSGRQRTHAP